MSAREECLQALKALVMRLEVEGATDKVAIGWDRNGGQPPINRHRCVPFIKDEDIQSELTKLVKDLFV